MNNEYNVKDKLTLFLLATGVFCFGSRRTSTHVKMVHYAAHLNEFLLPLLLYDLYRQNENFKNNFLHVLVSATLLTGRGA
jgi:hypothetical protein